MTCYFVFCLALKKSNAKIHPSFFFSGEEEGKKIGVGLNA
jgi:hypothetical protein